jgi:hypothetical protein
MLDSSYRIGSCGPHTQAVNGLKLRGCDTAGATSVAADSVAVAMATRFGYGHDAAGAPRCTVLLSLDQRNHGAVAKNPPRPRRHDEIRRCGDPRHGPRTCCCPLHALAALLRVDLTARKKHMTTDETPVVVVHAPPQCVGTPGRHGASCKLSSC